MLRIFLFETFVYISVVLISECPNKSRIYLISVPFSKRCVAKECLKVWGEILFLMPAFIAAFSMIFCIVLCVYLPLLFVKKTYPSLLGVRFIKLSLTFKESMTILSFLPFALFK